jgi:hypothetical protein
MMVDPVAPLSLADSFQIDVEDALGVAHQIQALTHTVKEKI